MKGYSYNNLKDGTGADIAVVDIFEEISDWWGYGLHSLIQDLTPAKDVVVRINSVGGLYFEAIAISNYLKASGKNVTTQVIGMAASSASVILMNGDKVQAYPNSWIMIHQASVGAWGNSKDLQSGADTLKAIDAQIVQTYLKQMKKAGKVTDDAAAVTKIENWMSAETWFTAEIALAEGLIDEIVTVESQAVINAVAPVPAVQDIYKTVTAKYAGSKLPTEFSSNFANNLDNNKNDLTMSKVKVSKTNFMAAIAAFFASGGNAEEVEIGAATEEKSELDKAKDLLAASGFTVTEAAANPPANTAATTVQTPAPQAPTATAQPQAPTAQTAPPAVDTAKLIADALAKFQAEQAAGSAPGGDGDGDGNTGETTKPQNSAEKRAAILAKHKKSFQALADAIKH